MNRSLRTLGLSASVVALCASGCARATTSTSGSNSTSAATGAPAAAPGPQSSTATSAAGVGTGGTTITTGGHTVTYGGDASQGAVAMGLPVYPNAKAQANGSMAISDRNGKERVALLSTGDDFDKVDGWYAAHISSDFKATRMHFGGVGLATYAKLSGASSSSVIIKSGKDSAGQDRTMITLVTKTKP